MRFPLLLLLLILIILPPGSNASSRRLQKFRVLEELGPSKEEPPEVIGSPSASPVLSTSLDSSPVTSQQSEGMKPHVTPVPADAPNAHLTDDLTNETCNMSSYQCRDQKSLFACLVPSASAQQDFNLVAQNVGESMLKVNVLGLPVNMETEIPKHQVKKINSMRASTQSAIIVLNAGSGNCVIRVGAESDSKEENSGGEEMNSGSKDSNTEGKETNVGRNGPVSGGKETNSGGKEINLGGNGPVSGGGGAGSGNEAVLGGNISDFFPSYAKQVHPIHGAYLSIFAALVIGGTWACCKLRKGGQHVDGVPYQELEMGQAESLSANNVETDEGWDQGWDGEWDDENAVKPGEGNVVENSLASKLTAKSHGRDEWENDWDD